jgi:hypothetical protein
VNQRARDLALVLRGQLADLGPGTCSVSVREIASWAFVRIGMASADTARVLASDLGLEQARTASRGVWWRLALPTESGIVVVQAGLHRG